ncbi:MAG: SPASM domain-containing protein [Leptospirales bacterium]
MVDSITAQMRHADNSADISSGDLLYTKPDSEQLYYLQNIHLLELQNSVVALKINNSAFFELEKEALALLNAFYSEQEKYDTLQSKLIPITRNFIIKFVHQKSGISYENLNETFDELVSLGLIGENPEKVLATPQLLEPAVSNLVLILAGKCNLACSYCYADKGSFQGPESLMEEKTAYKAVDFLIENSDVEPSIHINFFGGEPLLNFPVLKSTVAYAKKRAAVAKKMISFSVTTNSTLLNEKAGEFFSRENISISTSLDGSATLHDANRKYPSGKGSFEDAKNNILSCKKNYPELKIGVRVTLTKEEISLKRRLFDLLELGFSEVGFSPVSSADPNIAFSDLEYAEFTSQFEELITLYIETALQDQLLPVSNISNFLSYLHDGIVKNFPCGGAIGLMGVNPGGELFLCHRLIGQSEYALGNIYDGIDRTKQAQIIESTAVGNKQGCTNCWAKHFCGGGCHYEVHLQNDNISATPLENCKWFQSWAKTLIEAYVIIMNKNPQFIDRYIDQKSLC